MTSPSSSGHPKSVLFVLPIYNEEVQLAWSVETLYKFAAENLSPEKYNWRIAVGDNASKDRSPEIAQELAKKYRGKVEHIRLEQKGRGRLLKKVWLDESFDYSLYYDVDLSTDLKHIPPMLKALDEGSDLAIGVRLGAGAVVKQRKLFREITSRGYCAIVHVFGRSKLRDFQCGFKAITKQAALRYLPFVEDVTWFFDTELLLIAEHSGGKIYQEPVFWTDDPGTTVHVGKTARDDLEGLARVMRTKPWLKVQRA